MSDDRIAEIRARHNYTEEMWWAAEDPCANQAHADRATLLAEVERLARERDEARAEAEIRPAVYVLLSDDRGIEDLDRQSDEICGCYLSLDAAERAGNELNVRWRIEEYGLEGKS